MVGDAAHVIADGGVLFYPCAGSDWDEIVQAFAPSVTEFWFCDPKYDETCVVPVSGFRIEATEVDGDPLFQGKASDRGYRQVPRCVWSSRMSSASFNGPITVNRRRGFGEYALTNEFADRSISVFVHRGDTTAGGEGSSGSVFLGRRKRRHEPLTLLFDKLSRKLRDKALIVSDGSNTDINELRIYHNGLEDGSIAFANMRERSFSRWGFDWQCIGYLGRRYGPTLIWEVRRR